MAFDLSQKKALPKINITDFVGNYPAPIEMIDISKIQPNEKIFFSMDETDIEVRKNNRKNRKRGRKMFNRITLMGRICNDLELKSTPNGVSVLTFRIAVDRSFSDKSGERQTDFFNIVTWRSTAEFAAKYFAKGKLLLVDGELQTRHYVDKNNVNQTVYEVVAEKVRFTGDGKKEQTAELPPCDEGIMEILEG
jgi:single stranded DNA-binding protein